MCSKKNSEDFEEETLLEHHDTEETAIEPVVNPTTHLSPRKKRAI